MYKFYTNGASVRDGIVKFLIMMKFSIVLLIISSMQLNAASWAQNITIIKKEASLEEIFKELRKQSDYDFIYSEKQLSESKKVTLNVRNADIKQVLEKCFSNQPFTYAIENKTVIVKAKAPSFSNKIIVTEDPINVHGMVVNEQDQPMAGATIKVKGTQISTFSNKDGIFQLNSIERNALLSLIYLGYEVKEVKAKPELGKIVLVQLSTTLDEKVIIGYGTTTRKFNTGSVSSISSQEIQQQPVTNILSALSGRMPGVLVQTTNGLPGGNISIQIRGTGSIAAGIDPLYIIDGVPYDGSSPNGVNSDLPRNSITGTVSPLNNINPADIETITVLKVRRPITSSNSKTSVMPIHNLSHNRRCQDQTDKSPNTTYVPTSRKPPVNTIPKRYTYLTPP